VAAIEKTVEALGLERADIELYGRDMAKIRIDALEKLSQRPLGRYICVTAMSPTPAGEGKTTVAIALADALAGLGHNPIVTLRQPSLGPILGIKGGGSGGGLAQVVPRAEMNLGLTGDIAAAETAQNLLAALIDNHLHHGNPLQLNPQEVSWRRALDLEDRALRRTVTGLGGGKNGVPRETGFDITAASEVMAILSLAGSFGDLRERLGKVVVGRSFGGSLVSAEDLQAAGAMAALLRHALKPNLLQTLRGTPALVHGAAFANLGIGNSSVMADRIALRLGDSVITECGFGAELGFEKFANIKCRLAGLEPCCAVVVATVRALKFHSGGRAGTRLTRENPDLLRLGAANLARQISNVTRAGLPAVVAINRFEGDDEAELALAQQLALEGGAVAAEVASPWSRGGNGTEALASAVLRAAQGPNRFRSTYDLCNPLAEKIACIARDFYGASGVRLTSETRRSLDRFQAAGYADLPLCMVKTHLSLSHDPALYGRPEGFVVPVTEVRLAAGAGYVLALCGDVQSMPGLPASPAGERIDLTASGEVVGLE